MNCDAAICRRSGPRASVRSFQNVLGLALLLVRRTEIDAAKESGDKELVVIQLSNQARPIGLGFPTAGPLPDVPYDTNASHDPNFRVSVTFPCSSATA